MLSAALSTHLADFETTIAEGYTARDFLAALNFAALLHERLYLSDIALGDHPLVIGSYLHTTDQQLFRTLAELIRNEVVLCLLRDKVVVRDKILVASSPSISEIYEGWRIRGPDVAFTTQNFSGSRKSYNRDVDELLFKRAPSSVIRYDSDYVKSLYRDRIWELANRKASPLTNLLTPLPGPVRRAYDRIWDTNDFFTNADFYTLLRNERDAEAVIVAHGHINQQCFADFVRVGQTGHEHPRLSVEKFDWEANTVGSPSMTMDPPVALEELFGQAKVFFQASCRSC